MSDPDDSPPAENSAEPPNGETMASPVTDDGGASPAEIPRRSQPSRRLLLSVMTAIGVWGGLLALGAFLFGYDEATGEVRYAPNAIRGLIVLGCVTFFLAGWGLLLARRPRVPSVHRRR